MISNLVYPSVSSLVSKLVEEGEQGEALGALNGIKALTEGFGPLIFGLLMGYFENTSLPGAPYLVAAAFSAVAMFYSIYLPTEPEFILSKKESFKAINNQDNESASSLLDK
jgi:MFS family permease